MENKEPIILENTVIDSFKADIKWIEPKVEDINEYEKEMLKTSKNVKQLLEEEEKEKTKELSEEEKTKLERSAYITKIKVIALDKMGKHPLMNPSLFHKKEKDQLIKLMEEVMKEDNDVIEVLFNEICSERIFHPNAEYSSYPIYKELV